MVVGLMLLRLSTLQFHLLKVMYGRIRLKTAKNSQNLCWLMVVNEKPQDSSDADGVLIEGRSDEVI